MLICVKGSDKFRVMEGDMMHKVVIVMRGYTLMFVMGGILAGCASTPPTRQVAAAQHPAIQSFAGAPSGGGGDVSPSNRAKTNLPSAPVNTPLCGTALHEQARTGAGVYSRSLAVGNSCARNACFQPLTGTFIAQDGNNSVCR